MAEDLALEQNIALAAVRAAARLCQAVRDDLAAQALHKADRSPVTVADFGSQALVGRALAAAFPRDAVIAEEDSNLLLQPEQRAMLAQVVRYVQTQYPDADAAGVCRWIDHRGARHNRHRIWTLDPIDGTKGFVRGDQYAVSLALIVDGQVTVAALACPALPLAALDTGGPGSVYTAVHGQGAFAHPTDDVEDAVPVHVSRTEDPARARLCEPFERSHTSQSAAMAVAAHLGIATRPARLDGQGKYAVVARGEADIYLRLPSGSGYVERSWDHAAGMLIVVEAGGIVSDVHGQALDFSHGHLLNRNQGVVATNGWLHERVLTALAAVGTA